MMANARQSNRETEMTDRLLDTNSIIASAEIASGATGLMNDGLRGRVDNLLAQFRASEEKFTKDQKAAARRQVVKLLARRLNIERDLRKHPEILNEEISDPIFIIGFARTGTSIQQALFDADPANEGVRAWQVHEPSPPPGETAVTGERKRAAGDVVRHFVETCPGIMTLHPYWDNAENTLIEDEEIWTLDFWDNYPVVLCDAPTLAIREGSADLEGAYRWLKTFLQHQQWKRPRRRWVLKGIEHQRHLSTLFKVFPGARVLFPHREPESFLPSNLAIAAVVYDAITLGALDRPTLAAGYLADFRQRLEAVMNDPAMDDHRVKHMKFEAFIADPVGAMRQCYQDWGFTWSSETENAMRTWLDDPSNNSDRYGRHKYAFEPFAVNWAQQSVAFEPYRQRYLTN